MDRQIYRILDHNKQPHNPLVNILVDKQRDGQIYRQNIRPYNKHPHNPLIDILVDTYYRAMDRQIYRILDHNKQPHNPLVNSLVDKQRDGQIDIQNIRP